MKRRVKWINQRKNEKTYSQAWIGYSYRNKNGVPDFKREFSLKDFTKKEIDAIDTSLRFGGDISIATKGNVEFLDSLDIGGYWVAYCIAEQLGIINEISQFEEKYQHSILSMILDRVIQPLPHSKLSLWESLPSSSLARVVAPRGINIELHYIYISLEKSPITINII